MSTVSVSCQSVDATQHIRSAQRVPDAKQMQHALLMIASLEPGADEWETLQALSEAREMALRALQSGTLVSS